MALWLKQLEKRFMQSSSARLVKSQNTESHFSLISSKEGGGLQTVLSPAALQVCWGSIPQIYFFSAALRYLQYTRSLRCTKAYRRETKTLYIPFPHRIGTSDTCSNLLAEVKSVAMSACVWYTEGTLEQWGTALLFYARPVSSLRLTRQKDFLMQPFSRIRALHTWSISVSPQELSRIRSSFHLCGAGPREQVPEPEWCTCSLWL